jgi:very-short-patch-repair endonuclease
MTDAEKILWEYVRDKKLWYKFLRQNPMYVFTENNWQNRFIVPDFYCAERKLIIEVDWSVHHEKEILDLDQIKEDLINKKWLQIIRIKNEDIFNNIDLVIQDILKQLTK